jgi:hypothetical protein
MKIESEKLLHQEREKLNRLVDEALQRGTPIGETHEIREQFRQIKRMAREALQSEAVLAQSYRVDKLVVMVEREKEKEG